MHSQIVNGERVSENEFKLITEEGTTYFYKCLPTYSESFLKEEIRWRLRVVEGEQLLLGWIHTKKGKSPAYICWNYEGRAMLHVNLFHTYNDPDEDNIYGVEINPAESKDIEDWVKDPNCPNLRKSKKNV